MKNFNILGVYWKIRPLGGGVTKNQYIGGIGQFVDLRGGLGKKGGCFWGGVDTPMSTMIWNILCKLYCSLGRGIPLIAYVTQYFHEGVS